MSVIKCLSGCDDFSKVKGTLGKLHVSLILTLIFFFSFKADLTVSPSHRGQVPKTWFIVISWMLLHGTCQTHETKQAFPRIIFLLARTGSWCPAAIYHLHFAWLLPKSLLRRHCSTWYQLGSSASWLQNYPLVCDSQPSTGRDHFYPHYPVP